MSDELEYTTAQAVFYITSNTELTQTEVLNRLNIRKEGYRMISHAEVMKIIKGESNE